MHGAGLSHALWMRPGAYMLELIPTVQAPGANPPPDDPVHDCCFLFWAYIAGVQYRAIPIHNSTNGDTWITVDVSTTRNALEKIIATHVDSMVDTDFQSANPWQPAAAWNRSFETYLQQVGMYEGWQPQCVKQRHDPVSWLTTRGHNLMAQEVYTLAHSPAKHKET